MSALSFQQTHPDFFAGFEAGKRETQRLDFDLGASLMLFEIDPPDSEYQKGFLLAVRGAKQ